MKTKTFIGWIILLFVAMPLPAQELKVAAIFSNNMVLQRESQAPIWGTGRNGSRLSVTTSWNDKTYEAVVDKENRWKVELQTPAAGGPYSVKIKGDKEILLENVLIGEVWLASGQSNMSMQIKGYSSQPVLGATEAILHSKGKKIRFINIPIMAAYKPLDNFEAAWEVASPQTTAECIAIGWFFADFLYRNLGIPIGIINASYGGSNVEAWMTPEACTTFTDIVVPPTSDETSPWINNVPTVLYNGMLHPVVGYGIRGAIWYQGESNIFNVPRYAPSVAAMVKSWREHWNRGEFPFFYAQIAPYDYKAWNFFTPQWPEISAYQREAQTKCLDLIPNSGMAVLMDVGDPEYIHPPKKKEVGERLGLLALAKTYGMTGFEYESPLYSHMEIEGNKAFIYFKNLYNGLTSFGRPLELFEIAGENKVFHRAEAYIDESRSAVVVSSRFVTIPKAVRYAFRDYIQGDLFGICGLPVPSFRTDDW